MSDSRRSVSVLGTRWADSERWDIRRRGFLGLRLELVTLPPVRFLDWTIDGRPLRDRLAFADGQPCDDITFMSEGSEGDPFVIASLRALLFEDEPGFDPWVKFTDGRAGVLFCPQCGGLDCGAVSADVRFTDNAVEWLDVAYQGDITEAINTAEVPSFSLRFDRTQYQATLRALLAQWGSDAIAS